MTSVTFFKPDLALSGNTSTRLHLTQKIAVFRNSLRILNEHFVDLVIEKQDVLSSKERWDGVLALVPDCIL